jgi:hypothetical protein
MNSGHTKMVRHPHSDAKITLGQFFEEFGGRHEKRWAGTGRPAPLCYICRCEMATKGEDRPVHAITIAHWPNASRPCPLRCQADHKYHLLPNGQRSTDGGMAMKAAFMREWWHHYNVIFAHVGLGYDIEDFIERVELADEYKLWERAKLQLWEIPYIFLVWRAFEPVFLKKKQVFLRDHWVRFWLDPNCRAIDDLWIRGVPEMRLIRAIYRRPAGKAFPNHAHLIKEPEEFTVSPWRPSERTARVPHEFKTTQFLAKFPQAATPA